MVATWQPAAPANYYQSQSSYYLGGVEPAGRWFAPVGDFGLVDGAEIDPDCFRRLYAGIGPDGKSLISSGRGRAADRTSAHDYTFSAPRSVSLAGALGSPEVKQAVEAAQDRAVRAALRLVEREASFARRGRNGERLESVALTAALFLHGDSRPARHADGKVFGDANCHVHAVCFNAATRRDGTVGALYSIEQRNFKMPAGAAYHAALAAELQALGFAIDRVGYNGVFEIRGVDDDLITYFSARRQEIEAELEKHGAHSREASALAAAVARATRSAKNKDASRNREKIWSEAARERGVDIENFARNLLCENAVDLTIGEKIFGERVAELPAELTRTQSVFERRELIRAIAAALVGTGLPLSRVDQEIERQVAAGTIVEIGADRAGRPRYSTPEMVQIERETVEFARRLTRDHGFGLPTPQIREICDRDGLNEEQTCAAVEATGPGAIAMIAGAAGSGKTTTLRAIRAGYKAAGRRVIGAASAWRVANALHDDLSIPSRAIASWREKQKLGAFLRRGDVLIVDEAGLLGARDTHALLSHAVEAGAKILLVGENRQLAPIDAGSGLDLCARALDAARIEKIVRQREAWAREAILAFRDGRSEEALDALAARGKLMEAQGAGAAIDAVVTEWRDARSKDSAKEPLLLCRTNADVAAISRAAREILREEGKIVGAEVEFATVTPSGQTTKISLARGDRIRFLARNDRLGVINGTTATIVAVHDGNGAQDSSAVAIHAEINGRLVEFSPKDVADIHGRARIGWAYASTIYQAQGTTTDRAIALVDAGYDRRQIYVAASRAREDTLLVVDASAIDRRLAADLPPDRQNRAPSFTGDERRTWLANRLSQARSKESTLDAMDAARTLAARQRRQEQAAPAETASENRGQSRHRSRELSLD